MDYITVWDVAEKWGITERMVRNYCIQGLIPGAYQTNHIWVIPENATKPRRKKREKSEALRPIMARKLGNQQKKRNFHGMYDYTLLNLTYSSCRMASCRLTRGQVESIIKNGKVAETFEAVKISDLIEVRNHIECTNFVLKAPMEPLTIKYIKDLHKKLFVGTVDEQLDRVVSGAYRRAKTKIKDRNIPLADEVPDRIKKLIKEIICISDASPGSAVVNHLHHSSGSTVACAMAVSIVVVWFTKETTHCPSYLLSSAVIVDKPIVITRPTFPNLSEACKMDAYTKRQA